MLCRKVRARPPPRDRGRPIFLISAMAMHTQNLRADPHASLLIAQADSVLVPLGERQAQLFANT